MFRRRIALVVTAAAAVLTVGGLSWRTAAAGEPDPLTAAWERAHDAGSYRFRSDLEQVVTPTGGVTGVGRTTSVRQFHLEGTADPGESTVEFGVWAGGGSLAVDRPTVEIRIADGTTMRRTDGGDWVESADTSSTVAPAGDTLGYLVAARDVTELGTATVGGRKVTKYAFELDGSAFATAMADRLEDDLRSRGELRPGTQVQPSAFHRDTTGEGELWVSEDGLPVRQTLQLVFPEQADESTTASITIDFFEFGDDGGIAFGMGDLPLPFVGLFVLLAAAVGIVVLLGTTTDRRPVIRGVATLLAVAITATAVVGNPSSAAGSDGPAPAATDEPVDAAAVASSRADLVADPNRSLVTPTATDDGPFAAPAVAGPSSDDGTDTDGDGLTDFVELRIGTMVEAVDTDGDTLDDATEVDGFGYGGVQWYPDPFQPDSNGDSVTDTVEYDVTRDGTPDDTDGDGLPDLFDDDNDGDGVPDHKDLSPFGASATPRGEDQPLAFAIDGADDLGGTSGALDEGLPLLVDIQLRPADQDHLQYALNALDWPSDDQGQIRDVNNLPDDVQLVPMLEIDVPDGSHELPTADELESYSITVTDPDPVTGGRTVYVPMQLVTDERSGARVAFSARMLYRSQDTWGPAHEMRLVWAVQIANDVVCDPDGEEEDCNAQGYLLDQPMAVQRYYEDWSLTGLQVTQEHGAEVALLHEDPTAEDAAGVVDHGPTWLLANVLSERFVTATDLGGGEVGQALPIDELAARFDRALLGDTETESAFGLPNVFRVEHRTYPAFGEAVNDTASVQVPRLLAERYDPTWTGADSVRPLVVMAYTTATRLVGLDAIASGDGTVSVDGSGTYRFDFDPTLDPVPVDTTVGLKWSHYCGGSGAEPVWSTCDAEQVWSGLAEQYEDVLLDPDDLTSVVPTVDEETAAAQTLSMQLFALAMTNGLSTLLLRNDGSGQVAVAAFEAVDDVSLTSETRALAQQGIGMVKILSNKIFFQRLQDTYPIVRKLAGFRAVSTLKTWILKGSPSSIGARSAVAVALAVVLIGITTAAVLAANGNEDAEVALKVVLVVGVFLIQVAAPVYTLTKVVQYLGGALKSVTSLQATALGASRTAGLIGLVLSIGLVWGFFIAGIVSGGVEAFSPAFNQALADSISATIFAIFLFALALTGVGLIIVGIVAIIDGILSLICEVGNVDELRTDLTDGGCFTLSGAAIGIVSAIFYSYDLMVDAEADDLVVTGSPDIGLTDPGAGYVVGNGLDVSLPVTSTVRHLEPSDSNWQIIPYLWFYSKANLRSSSMVYSLTSPGSVELETERDDMTDAWAAPIVHDEYIEKDLYQSSKQDTPSIDLPFDTAGLDREFEVNLNIGFALPAAECWTIPQPFVPPFVFPVCYTRTFDGGNSSAFDPLHYDVLPATLDGFIEQVDRPGGRHALAWDRRFPTFDDADFDGLLAGAVGGLDPDDTDWDIDDDGLSDTTEIERQQAGLAMSPRFWDTDADGLSDPQELRLGTDPGVADTDNDGLTDGEEVRHLSYSTATDWDGTWAGGWDVSIPTDVSAGEDGWIITPAPGDRVVAVSSSPLDGDIDGDGIGDLAERQLAGSADPADRLDDGGVPYHPGIANSPILTVGLSTDDADGFVRPGQDVTVRADVQATTGVVPGVVAIDVPAALGGPIAPDLLGFDPLAADDIQTLAVERTVTVADDAASGDVTVLADVSTRLPGGPAVPPEWTISDAGSVDGTRRHGWIDLVERGASRTDSFLLADESSTALTPGGGGDVRSVPFPGRVGEVPVALDIDQEPVGAGRNDLAYLRGDGSVDTTCHDDATCMTVWEHYDNCTTLTINSLTVVDQEEEVTSGIEPGIYLDRQDGEGQRLLWFSGSNGGNDMTDGATRGPNANGFPITTTYCGDASLSLFEIDGNPVTLDNYEVFQWTTRNGDNDLNVVSGQSRTLDETTVLNGLIHFTSVDYRDAQGAIISDCGLGSNRCNRVDLNVTITERPHDRIAGRTTAATGSTLGSQFQLASSNDIIDRNPHVAAWSTFRGDDWYLVTWERVDTIGNTRRLMGQVVTETDGQTSFSQGTMVELGTAAGHATDQVDVQMLSSRVDTFPVTAWRDWGSSIITMSSGLFPVTDVVVATDATNASRHSTFALAEDPVADRTLVVYEDLTGAIIGKLYSGSSATVVATATIMASGTRPQVSSNPLTGGWLVTARSGNTVQAVSLDDLLGSAAADQALPVEPPDGDTSYAIPPLDTGLACPAWSSLPATELRFEELPGTATFDDASRSEGDGTSAPGAAPDPGVAGAPGAAASDHAVRFASPADVVDVPDQVDDGVTLTFWYRAEQTASGAPFTIGTGTAGYLLAIDPADGDVTWTVRGAATTQTAVSTGLADGEWHFVAATRDAVTGALAVRVDATKVAGRAGSSAPDPLGVPMTITGGDGMVDLDHLRVHPVGLDTASIDALRNRTDQAYCVSMASVSGGFGVDAEYGVARHFFDEVDTRGGRLLATARTGLVVDTDLPISTVSVPTGVVAGSSGSPVTRLVGGTASDGTSGVALVEVSIDGGPWTAADGGEAWSFAVPVTDGVYSIRARSTDDAGNLGAASDPALLTVDGTAPSVSIRGFGGSVRPATDPVTGVRLLPISGSTTDTTPTSGIERVEVQLVPTGATARSDGWQEAALTGGNWALDYEFSLSSVEPHGVFGVLVRAVDGVGNEDTTLGTVTVDGAAPTATLGAVTEAITAGGTIDGTVVDTGTAGVARVEVALTPIQDVVDGSPVAPSWLAAEFERGRPQWSLVVPTGLENLYQVDLRTTDQLGNERIQLDVWRGIIDTAAPRVDVSVTATGNLDARRIRSEYRYRCVAEDRFLDESTFACAGSPLREPVRTFATDPALQTLFPDLVSLVGLEAVFNLWVRTGLARGSIRACDLYGNCSTDVTGGTPAVTAAMLSAGTRATSAPTAVTATRVSVTAPTDGEHVTDPVQVVFDAAAPDPIERIEVLVDGTVVATYRFTTDGPTVYEATTVVPTLDDGARSVTVRVTTTRGEIVDSDPVAFVADRTPPAVTILDGALTAADSWGPGTDVYRLRGTVTDGGTVAAVQVRVTVGDVPGPWTDAFFADGEWHIALPIPGADGSPVTIEARAFDLAGNLGATDVVGSVDLTGGGYVRPGTTIASCTGCTAGEATATFRFVATPGSNDASAYICRLDGLPGQVCDSPWTVGDLAVGAHTLEVTTVDVAGIADLSPATSTWTVQAAGPQPVVSSKPTDPSSDRTAVFEFTGPTGATFRCAVDGGEFVPCTSPYVIDGLAYGEHQFLLRVRTGAVSGNPWSYRWTVVNASPSALDQVVVTTKGVPVDLTLSADDTDQLAYRIVGEPRHGVLQGAAPDLVYVPFGDFVGFDSFTFEADDGQEISPAGTVDVIVGTEAPPTARIEIADGQADPTNVDPVRFEVTFDQDVTGFEADDLVLTGGADLTGAVVRTVAVEPDRRYAVTVGGVEGAGTLEVAVVAGAARNATLQPTTASATAVVAFDAVGPRPTLEILSVDPLLGGAGPVVVGIEFDEPVTGLTAGEIAVGGTAGIRSGTLTGSGASYRFTITDTERLGSVEISVGAGAVTDVLGNPSAAASIDTSIQGATLPPTGNGTAMLRAVLTALLLGLILVAISRRRAAMVQR